MPKYSFFPRCLPECVEQFPFAFINAPSLPVLKAITYRLIMATNDHD